MSPVPARALARLNDGRPCGCRKTPPTDPVPATSPPAPLTTAFDPSLDATDVVAFEGWLYELGTCPSKFVGLVIERPGSYVDGRVQMTVAEHVRGENGSWVVDQGTGERMVKTRKLWLKLPT